MIDAGGSLLVIEHNLDVIKTADYIIDLGPEGGDAGGQNRSYGHSGKDHGFESVAHRPLFESTSGKIKWPIAQPKEMS
ncbi:MAG TPA: hypothetical protein VGO68_09410 [Pyrinomonadaceae bacterium]|nr:hypothetical protein [Pyrinomonadaceae bacterium]